jgi:hypothetical protein
MRGAGVEKAGRVLSSRPTSGCQDALARVPVLVSSGCTNQDERRLATRPAWCEEGGGWWVARRGAKYVAGRNVDNLPFGALCAPPHPRRPWAHRSRRPEVQHCPAPLLAVQVRAMCRYVQDREMDSLARAPSTVWSAGLQRRIFVTRSL